jgi:hypothetical protein
MDRGSEQRHGPASAQHLNHELRLDPRCWPRGGFDTAPAEGGHSSPGRDSGSFDTNSAGKVTWTSALFNWNGIRKARKAAAGTVFA